VPRKLDIAIQTISFIQPVLKIIIIKWYHQLSNWIHKW